MTQTLEKITINPSIYISTHAKYISTETQRSRSIWTNACSHQTSDLVAKREHHPYIYTYTHTRGSNSSIIFRDVTIQRWMGLDPSICVCVFCIRSLFELFHQIGKSCRRRLFVGRNFRRERERRDRSSEISALLVSIIFVTHKIMTRRRRSFWDNARLVCFDLYVGLACAVSNSDYGCVYSFPMLRARERETFGNLCYARDLIGWFDAYCVIIEIFEEYNFCIHLNFIHNQNE